MNTNTQTMTEIRAARQSATPQPASPPPAKPLLTPLHSSKAQERLREKRRADDGQRRLIFAPLAWLKLRLLLHGGDTEVGAFGISAEHDLLYVEDLAVPKQRTTVVTVEFDDIAVADHFDDCLDRGIGPARCGRIWIHTHPASSARPSTTDERTFARVFGDCDWAVMAIVARGGASYARLRFGAGPGGSAVIPIVVDWERFPQDLLDREGKLEKLFAGWLDEYGTSIQPVEFFEHRTTSLDDKQPGQSTTALLQPASFSDPLERFDPFDRLDPLDRLYDQQLYDQELVDHFERVAYFEQQEVWP